MSDHSERTLQRELHQAGFYTQKAPSSGVGIEDPDTEERIDQADIVAIKRDSTPIPDSRPVPQQRRITTPRVLVIEDKHVALPHCHITDGEREQLARIQEVTGARAFFAVKWKYTERDHEFHHIGDLVDTGKHWKITEETSGMGLDEITG